MMPLYYYFTLFGCAVSSIVLSLVLLGVTIRQDDELEKYRTASWCLCVAFLVFGLANILQAGMEYDGHEEALTGVMTLFIGSVQAMMFTMVALVFIRPAIVTMRNMAIQLTIILSLSSFLFIARYTLPLSVFYIFYYVFICGYVLLMATYTFIFCKNYKVFKKQMMDYYEEEELFHRLRWIQWTFWSAVAVGVLSLLLLIDNHYINMILTPLFTAYFLFITISFINYQQYAQLILRAYESENEVAESQHSETDVTVTPSDVSRVADLLNEWVKQKRFVESDVSVNEIAEQMGTNSNALRDYFHHYIGEDFRSWRIRMRVEEAKRLIDDNPSIKITDVVRLTGFNDRPYFYRVFTKITGMSVVEYRKMKQSSQ